MNRAFRSFCAASRTPWSPIDAVLRLCVRATAISPAFPLVGPLPSTASADDKGSSLFGSFSGTMGPSDFSSGCLSDLWLLAFSDRPIAPSAVGAGGISQFLCKEFPRMHRVFDSAGSEHGSRLTPCPILPSAQVNNIGTPEDLISELNSCLRVPLSTLRLLPYGDRRMTQGRCGSLGLLRMTLSFTTPCRS